MSASSTLRNVFLGPRKPRHSARPASRRRTRRPTVEILENRLCLSSLVVTTSSDDVSHSGTSLRDAIAQANADAAAAISDTITFDASLNGATITLGQGQLELKAGTGVTTVDGGGQITVSGNKVSRVFSVDNGAHAFLTRLTIIQGHVSNQDNVSNGGRGGGVYNEGTLTVSDSTLSDNSTWADQFSPGGVGGGIYNYSTTLTVDHCTLSGNSGGYGGGIYNEVYSTATVDDLHAVR